MIAFLDKPLSIGGFDVKERCPKPMRKAVPPGSVFYLQNKKNLSFENIERRLKEIIHEETQKGFGAFEILPLN